MSKVTELKKPDLRQELAAIMSGDSGMSQTVVARQVGVSPTTISRWIKDEYAGDVPGLERKIRNWLGTYQQRSDSERALPKAPEYVATPTSSEIIAALEYAQIANDIVVVYGGAGTGKTKSIERFKASRPNIWVITASPVMKGVPAMLEALNEEVDLPPTVGGARMYRAICKKMTGTFGLLVVDEAHCLSAEALDQLRSIHDATGCGLALLGNEKVYSNMTGGNRAAYLDRLFSRVGMRLRLSKASKHDVDAILAAWEINPKGCLTTLRSIAASAGGLRQLNKVLRLSSMYALGEKRSVECQDINAARDELGASS
jgi:DNA transposition AAA+ family ATPase